MLMAAGSRLGAYRILRVLGEGGMGCVYEAEHAELKVRRALKVFSSDSKHGAELRKKFVAEGRILADLQHPRIVRVYDFAFDEATGTPYFAMDLVVSPIGVPQTLEDACRNGVTEDQVAGWFRDICEGLGYIHSKGVVHRDVSLDNILIDGEGHAVISDFGIAKITGDEYRRKIDVTVTMALPPGEALRWGKGLYQAPELKKGGEATPASDAYAVGVLLFRLLVGSWYTPETKLGDMLAGMEYNWPEVIGRLCAVTPRERLPEGDVALAPEGLRRLRSGSGRRKWLVGGVVLLLAALVSLLVLRPMWTRPEKRPAPVPVPGPRMGPLDEQAERRKDVRWKPAQSNVLNELKNAIMHEKDTKERR